MFKSTSVDHCWKVESSPVSLVLFSFSFYHKVYMEVYQFMVMVASNLLETYYRLFISVVENPRVMPKGLQKEFDYYGRGRARSTLLHHLQTMYAKGISREPNLALKAFHSSQKTTYFCRRAESRGLYSLFKKIDQDPRITYSLCFSSSDFFLISKDCDLPVEDFGLTCERKSNLYTPMYTIPRNWMKSVTECLSDLVDYPYKRGNIERIIYEDPPWDNLDWNIFHFMKSNIRAKFTVVARNTGGTSKTVKDRFYNHVLPHCVVAHYFYPTGSTSYNPIFLSLKTGYEKSVIKALEKLPCTSYVFPLETRLVVILFYDPLDTVVRLVNALEKLEEIAIINNYLLYCPIIFTK